MATLRHGRRRKVAHQVFFHQFGQILRRDGQTEKRPALAVASVIDEAMRFVDRGDVTGSELEPEIVGEIGDRPEQGVVDRSSSTND